MNAADASKEIADLNFTYMLLAQKLLREDKPAAMLRLGISPEMADLLGGMALPELIKIATSNFVLCAFRLDELPIFRTVMQGTGQSTLQQAHLSILFAGAQAQAGPKLSRTAPAQTAVAATA
ncbi:MAG: flagellar transcriptional regulator FlhD [Ramlibacter sp.]|nr:flagellar transcriptional regulator FlhD [Ramlibacter sp.]